MSVETTSFVYNKFTGSIPVTDAQREKAYALHLRFGGDQTEWNWRHFWTEGDMIVSKFGNMIIGILPDGSYHS